MSKLTTYYFYISKSCQIEATITPPEQGRKDYYYICSRDLDLAGMITCIETMQATADCIFDHLSKELDKMGSAHINTKYNKGLN